MPHPSHAASMRLDHAVTELFLAKDYTASSADHRRAVLGEFLRWAAQQEPPIVLVRDVTRAVIRRYLTDLRERENVRYGGHLSGETQHSRASILRMFLHFCAREDWLDERVVRDFEMPKKGKKVLQVLTREQYKRLAQTIALIPTVDPNNRGLVLRDQALLALLLDTGLRAMEVCNLTLDDVHIAPKEAYLHIRGKGRSEREIGIGKETALAVHRYRTRGRPNVESSSFFLSRRHEPLTPNAIDRMLTRLKRAAGPHHFTGLRLSAHTFRHSFAVHYLQQGGDVYKLSRLLGHESVTTTQRYLSAFTARDARRTSKSVLDNL